MMPRKNSRYHQGVIDPKSAKKYFDDNVREDSKLFYQYLKILDKKSKNKNYVIEWEYK